MNSFLQFIEADDSDSLLIAATNHGTLLDRALIRRFDDVMSFTLPNRAALIATLKRVLGFLPTPGVSWGMIAEAAEGLSYAETVRAAEDAAKDAVLASQATLSEDELLKAVGERKRAHDSVSID